MFSRVGNSKKRVFWELGFWFIFLIYILYFLQSFLCNFIFQSPWFFSHLSYYIYLIIRIFLLMRKSVCDLLDHQVAIFALAYCYPSCGEVVVGSWLSAYPSCGEVIFVLALVPYLLCRGSCCWREKVCSPCIVLPKSSVEVPCVGSPLWTH